jgi:hypothetical protein
MIDEYYEEEKVENDNISHQSTLSNKKIKEGFGAIGTSLPYKADTTHNVLTNTLIMINQLADQYPVTPEKLYKIADECKYCEKDIVAYI